MAGMSQDGLPWMRSPIRLSDDAVDISALPRNMASIRGPSCKTVDLALRKSTSCWKMALFVNRLESVRVGKDFLEPVIVEEHAHDLAIAFHANDLALAKTGMIHISADFKF